MKKSKDEKAAEKVKKVRDGEEKALNDAKAAYQKFIAELDKINDDTANCNKACTAYTNK